MSNLIDDRIEALQELSAEEQQQAAGGTSVELMLTVTDSEVGAGTLIPVKVKHNV